jgi:hypothetical protein
VDAARAETYLRLLAEAELRRAPSLPLRGPAPHRVWLAAATLTAAGAVEPEVARQTVADFEAAASLRTADRRRAVSVFRRPAAAALPLPGAARDPAVTPRAVPAGPALRLPPEREGWYGELRLMALVITDSQAVLTAATRWAGQTRRSPRPRPSHAPLQVAGALDDGGHSYRAFLGDAVLGDGREWWDCHLGLAPVPAPGTRWLDVGPGAGGAHVRIDLTATPTPAAVTADTVRPARRPALQLDRAGDDLLHEGVSATPDGAVVTRVAQIIGDLVGCGAASPDDPAVLRLATLGRLLGLDLGAGVTGSAPLPNAWASLLTDGDAGDGPEGIASFAVALPPVDGVSLALAGLRSSADQATLHVMTGGRVPRGGGWLVPGYGPRSIPPGTALSWRARDSTGRWHLMREMTGDGGPGMMQMHLIPPLHPAATSLKVIVTGTYRRVQATVPLRWQAAG